MLSQRLGLTPGALTCAASLLVAMLAFPLLATPAAAVPVPVQKLNDATTAWLRATLHAPVDDRTVIVTDDMDPQNLAA